MREERLSTTGSLRVTAGTLPMQVVLPSSISANRLRALPLESAVNELIETKEGAGRSERYCKDLRLRLGRLCAAFDCETIAQISTADLGRFLSDLNVAAETRNTFRRDMRTLWSFAEKHGWATATTAKNTEKAKTMAEPPGVLTPEQAAALLGESNDDLLAFHAIGLSLACALPRSKPSTGVTSILLEGLFMWGRGFQKLVPADWCQFSKTCGHGCNR
jgi:hypothetical protein